MAGKRRFSVEREKYLCAKEWGAKDRDNLATSWYTNGRTWRKMKDNRIGDKKLLVVRDN